MATSDPGSGKRALVVDDSSTMRAILRSLLRKRGFTVVEAGNGIQALAVLTGQEPVDVMLIDWNMPEMDGFTLLERIRGQQQYDCTKIAMITTEMSPQQMGHALDAGADEYIMKPFTAEVIYDKLTLLGL